MADRGLKVLHRNGLDAKHPAMPTVIQSFDVGNLTSLHRRAPEHLAGPVWRADEILAAIDAIAERAGRRARSRGDLRRSSSRDVHKMQQVMSIS